MRRTLESIQLLGCDVLPADTGANHEAEGMAQNRWLVQPPGSAEIR